MNGLNKLFDGAKDDYAADLVKARFKITRLVAVEAQLKRELEDALKMCRGWELTNQRVKDLLAVRESEIKDLTAQVAELTTELKKRDDKIVDLHVAASSAGLSARMLLSKIESLEGANRRMSERYVDKCQDYCKLAVECVGLKRQLEAKIGAKLHRVWVSFVGGPDKVEQAGDCIITIRQPGRLERFRRFLTGRKATG